MNDDATAISISQLRLAQTAFEPSVTPDQNDLLINKPFAVEATISGTVNDSDMSTLVKLDVLLDSLVIASSTAFRLGDVVSGKSKAFAFATVPTSGVKTLTAKLSPAIAGGNFVDKSPTPPTRTVNFRNVTMRLLVGSVTGCSSGYACFSNFAGKNELNYFRDTIVPYTESKLPISKDGLSTWNSVFNWSFAIPGSTSSIYRDLQFLYWQKMILPVQGGVMLVGTDYFIKNKLLIGSDVHGLVLPKKPNFVILRPDAKMNLAHELIHSLTKDVLNHSPITLVEGFGTGPKEVWTDGTSLDPEIPLKGKVPNLFQKNPPFEAQNNYAIDTATYNTAFAKILAPRPDPKVVLITGIIGADGKPINIDIHRAETVLEDPPLNPDVVIEGLDSKGRQVTSVTAELNSSIEALDAYGNSTEVPTAESFFAVALPDNGDVQSFRVIRAGKILASGKVDSLTLQRFVDSLQASDFRFPLFGPSLLKESKAILANYRSLVSKGKRPQARLTLVLLDLLLRSSLKPTFTLATGIQSSIMEFQQLVDAELRSLK